MVQGNVNFSGKNVVVVSKDICLFEGVVIWVGDFSKLQGGLVDVIYLLFLGGVIVIEIQVCVDELCIVVMLVGLSGVNVVVVSVLFVLDLVFGKLFDQWGMDLCDVKMSWNGGSL